MSLPLNLFTEQQCLNMQTINIPRGKTHTITTNVQNVVSLPEYTNILSLISDIDIYISLSSGVTSDSPQRFYWEGGARIFLPVGITFNTIYVTNYTAGETGNIHFLYSGN